MEVNEIISETGNAKNAANFAQVINIVTALGAAYNPSQALIELTALQTKLSQAQTALTAVNAKDSAETNLINQRVAEFDGIGKPATRIGSAVAVSVNNELFSNDVRTIVRKLQGGRAGEKPVDDPLTPDIDESKAAHSVSQQSYDNLVSNFGALVSLLQTQTDYKPNETEVKLATLEAKQAAMETKNSAAKVGIIDAQNARAARDEILYHPETGVLNLVNLVKKYVAYAFGKDSPAYQQINALKFKHVTEITQ